ncbi:nucleotidyltransferase domain protein [hydrocarbon metagenome]|uniref:Nucleotidyltransferase domain protein n=1 Tax=hydrocarbon metagenome TaxID=938273 RepID=A0A0W8G059_9ZZZZ
MINKKTISMIIERLSDFKEIEKIILFGSQARREALTKSDIDLIVIMQSFEDRFEVSRRLRKKLVDIEYAFDIIVMTTKEFELDKNIPGTISRYASREGQILYAA